MVSRDEASRCSHRGLWLSWSGDTGRSWRRCVSPNLGFAKLNGTHCSYQTKIKKYSTDDTSG